VTIFRKLRSKIGYALLNRKAKLVDRSVHAVHLYSAKKAAVIFQPTDQSSFEMVQKFIKSLKDEGADVTAVGFVREKKMPNIFLLRKGFVFFCYEDLNWYCKPIAPFVESFIKEKFDILIDLSLDRNLPVDYLSYLSKAGFKAGKHFEKGHPFDLTIDISKNNQLSYLIEQLQHYLSLINKPVKHETAEI
jgi:hypothetical protein